MILTRENNYFSIIKHYSFEKIPRFFLHFFIFFNKKQGAIYHQQIV